ncbi:exocyst complex component 8 isoform X2 [Zootermopsis nevadensis]|uniref:Exocyst complex component 8 n=1 Tax=Zootermopsis nevadensis TaxID=136037 RepID=A0A067QXD9_ZOONE|nr:exocyst complex component 8 isoform X2 [Zootermopsis nevadensis]KDR14056.1 Exocyst complex component 8 [Zootermopsis nevadensis]
MADIASKKIGASDFNPEKYVKELSQRCVGGQELQQQRQKIQTLADETNNQLKKNVYQNYMQFIETAKEISHLESEMYQLSHMLSEQRSLLSSLATTSLLGDKIPSAIDNDGAVGTPGEGEEGKEEEEEERRRKLAAILEKVEGCVTLLETPGRTIIHEGDLLELDPIENGALQRVHAYLFSDGYMIASWIPNRRGPVRYKFEAMYELGSLAVVNVRDMSSVKMAFKLLAFPDTRVFQCTSNQSKKEWLDKFEQAKKARLAQDQLKRESTNITERSPLRPSHSESLESPSNPFEDADDSIPEAELPEWLLEVPEDLDVCIAQRHFEEAYNLLERAREFLDKNTTTDPVITDIRRKVEARVKALTEVLMKELEVSPDKSLQGGLRAARRAVRLLNQLGRSTQACDLFLKLCSCILKTQLKRVKREGATILYVRQIGGIFFSNLTDMTREFLRAFPHSPSCASAFVVWAGSELTHLTSHLIKQIFMPQSSITMLAECITCVRIQCDQLCELGVDLRYQLDGLLRTPLTRALRDAREKLVDAVKLRAAEDKWRPMNLQSKAGLTKFLQEMSDIGIASIHTYVTGDCWLGLTGNTVAFSKLYLTLLEDCLRLATPELLYTVDEVLSGVFQAQILHVEASLSSDKYKAESKFIQKNAGFLLDTLLTLAEHCYEEKIGNPCAKFSRLRDDYSWLKKDTSIKKSVKPVTKYSTTEYI